MIARSPGVRLLETSIRTTWTMADARQRDAEATWPVQATASVVMIEEAGWRLWEMAERIEATPPTRACAATGAAGAVY